MLSAKCPTPKYGSPCCIGSLSAIAISGYSRDLPEDCSNILIFYFQWNISDYLYHNRDKLVVALANDTAVCPEVPNHAELPPLDKLWMCLYIRLSEYRYKSCFWKQSFHRYFYTSDLTARIQQKSIHGVTFRLLRPREWEPLERERATRGLSLVIHFFLWRYHVKLSYKSILLRTNSF